MERFLAEYSEFRGIHGALKFKNHFVCGFANDPAPVIVKNFGVNLFEFMDQIDCPIFVNVEQLLVAIDRSKEDGG